MATVRIYKVAELLGATSQEVLTLLKHDHGIELKSASSTLEEVVARSVVERAARAKGIALPSGDMFAEHAHAPAAPAKGGGKKAPVLKKAEPPKAPPAPVLGPPRLIKTIKPLQPHPAEGDAPVADAPAPFVPEHEPEAPHVESEPAYVAPVYVAAELEPAAPAHVPEPVVEPAPPVAAVPVAEVPSEQPLSERPASTPQSARVVPSTIRIDPFTVRFSEETRQWKRIVKELDLRIDPCPRLRLPIYSEGGGTRLGR